MGNLINIDSEYASWLADLKQRIRQSQTKAAISVNATMIELYWSIGADIVDRQAESKWGGGIIPQTRKQLCANLEQLPHFLKYLGKYTGVTTSKSWQRASRLTRLCSIYARL